jgi:secreted Zn-dependent insulinase-like peptidase
MSSLVALRSSAEHFNTVRQQLHRNWQATHQNKPVNHLFSLLHHQLQYGAYTAQQLADSIVDLDFQHYCDLLPGMLRDAQALVLIHGDIDGDTATQIGHWVAASIPVVAEPKTHVSRTVKRLNQETLRVTLENQHSDHAFALFFQGESTQLTEKAAFLILNHLFSARFFHQLRTEQQLGYLVGSSYLPMHGIPGLLCYVQSPNTTAPAIELAVNQFLENFIAELNTLDKVAFQYAQQAVLHHLTDSAPNLRTRAQRYWSSIINNRGDFQLALRVAEAVQSITLADLQHFACNRLGPERNAMLLLDSKAQQ